MQLRAGDGYLLRRPHRAWGTRYVVTHLQEVLTAHRASFPEAAPLSIGDLSRRRGGRLPPHCSHRTGRDVDIWVPSKVVGAKRHRRAARRLDVPRIWALISALRQSSAVEMIFFDYRLQRVLYRYAKRELNLSRAELGQVFEYPHRRRHKGPIKSLIIHSPGHRDHLHVRFYGKRLAPTPTS